MQDTWLAEAWATELVSVLHMMTTQDFEFTLEYAPVPPLSNEVWWGQSFNIAPGAPVRIGAGESAWMDLGKRSLEAAGIDEVEPDTARSTYLEIVQQSVAATAGALSKRLGRDVECLREDKATGNPPSHGFAIVIRSGATVTDPIYLYVHPDLQKIVSPVSTELDPGPPLPQSQASLQLTVPSSQASADLLMDVELPVSISFGKTHLPLRDVLKFTAGSIVELNRHPEDSVEVVINNCVIARGEVVVVDGNYGVRIQEIVSRQQRMAIRTVERSAIAGR